MIHILVCAVLFVLAVYFGARWFALAHEKAARLAEAERVEQYDKAVRERTSLTHKLIEERKLKDPYGNESYVLQKLVEQCILVARLAK